MSVVSDGYRKHLCKWLSNQNFSQNRNKKKVKKEREKAKNNERKDENKINVM